MPPLHIHQHLPRAAADAAGGHLAARGIEDDPGRLVGVASSPTERILVTVDVSLP
jgi:hypothetical protein